MSRSERGFTLVEVMLALLVSGIVLLLSHELISAVADARGRISVYGASSERHLNRIQWLRDAFRTLDTGSQDQGSFQGGKDQIEFSSLLLTSRGWPERRRIHLVAPDNGRLIALVSNGDTLVLGEDVASLRVDYLMQLGEAGSWVQEWRSPSTAPLAVRLRLTRHSTAERASADTLLFLIGERG